MSNKFAGSVGPKQQESYALTVAMSTFAIATAVAGLIFYGHTVAFSGARSLSILATLFAGVTALIVWYVAEYYGAYSLAKGRDKQRSALRRMGSRVFLSGSLALVHGVIGVLAVGGLMYVLGLGFRELTFDWMTASLFAGMVASMVAYATVLSTFAMSSVHLATLLAIFLVSGALVSMANADDPLWWQNHLSYLGSSAGLVSLVAFNLTLIIGGLVIVVLADMISHEFAALEPEKTVFGTQVWRIVQVDLVLIGAMLAGVGLFPFDVYPVLHNSSAGGMAVAFIALVLLLRFMTTKLSHSFYLFSYLMVGALLLGYWLLVGPWHYFNLTAFEILCAGLVFSWLVVFIRQVSASRSPDE